jgi:phage terminase large subunit
VFIYTPRGSNHGLDTLKEAQSDPSWYASKLTAADCKVLTKPDLLRLRKELKDEALFQQEAFTSFTAPMQGAYYESQMKQAMKDKRITKVPPEPKLPVHTAWDLGYDDATSIWFFQQDRHDIRLIDYYEHSGEGLLHYAKVLKQKDYLYGTHYGPWDLAIHDLGTGKTRRETAQEMGIKFKVVKKLSIEEGIEACRNLLPKCWFDKEATAHGVNSLKMYRKEWDDEKQVFKNRPLHDFSSHAADAFRTLAVGIKDLTKKKKVQQYAITEYDPFSI